MNNFLLGYMLKRDFCATSNQEQELKQHSKNTNRKHNICKVNQYALLEHSSTDLLLRNTKNGM